MGFENDLKGWRGRMGSVGGMENEKEEEEV